MHRPVQENFFNYEELALPRPQAGQNCKKIMKKPGQEKTLPLGREGYVLIAKVQPILMEMAMVLADVEFHYFLGQPMAEEQESILLIKK